MGGQSLVFEQVVKNFGSVKALVDFNLTVKPGELLTLLGPSGSGKTTALNALAGFIEPDSGDIRIGDRSVVGMPPEKRDLGMVFQSYTLFPHMNVFDNIAFPLRLRREPSDTVRQKVERVLEMVQLPQYAKRMPKELSGGQQQRVAFARAVVSEPPVLLMDEPLAALDQKLRQAMQLEIKQYHAELGCTIIFVTHDQEEALILSDRVAVMGGGEIKQVDTPDGIYDKPNSRYVAEFIGKTNILTYTNSGDNSGYITELKAKTKKITKVHAQQCLLSIRPEKISRIQHEQSKDVRFSAKVDEVLFLGNIVQYSVRLPDGSKLLFQEHRDTSFDTLKIDQVVDLQFDTQDAYQLKDESLEVKYEYEPS